MLLVLFPRELLIISSLLYNTYQLWDIALRSTENYILHSCFDSYVLHFRVHCMFLVLFPWGSIAIINAWIISSLLYNTKQFRDIELDPKKVAEREQQDRQITRTLLMVTFTFLILLAWQCINQCFFMLKYGEGKYNTLYCSTKKRQHFFTY